MPDVPEGFEPVAPEGFEPVQQQDQTQEIPQAFRDRVAAGSRLHDALGRVASAMGQGAMEGLGTEPFGIDPHGQTEKDLQDIGVFPREGEVGPLRLMNKAIAQPAAAGVDAFMRLLHAGSRGLAGGVAQLTEEFRTDLKPQEGGNADHVEKDKNELDTAAQLSLLLAGSSPMARVGRGPLGAVRDEPIGGLPRAQDFDNAAAVMTDGQKTPALAAKLDDLWHEQGVHPAEAAADAEQSPVLKQELMSSREGTPEFYSAGIQGKAPMEYGHPDWNNWENADARRSIATRQLPDGQVVPAPDEVASYLQDFGRQVGFKFQVMPETDNPYAGIGNTPKFNRIEYDGGDGTRWTQALVAIPDNPDYMYRQWFGLGKSEVLFHEVGHALDYFVLNDQKLSDYRAITNGSPGLADEMLAANKQFAPKLWDENPAYRGKPREMMADSIAVWLSNPEIRKQMPLFTAKYGDKLQKYLDIAERALPTKVDGEWKMPPEQEQGFKGGGPGGEVPIGDAGGGSGGKPPGNDIVPFQPPAPPPPPAGSLAAARQKILDRLSINESNAHRSYSVSQLYTDTVDKFFPISKARQGAELTAENDPYKLVRLFAGWTGKADHMLNEATFDFNTYENSGPSLKAILDPVKKDLDGFRAFMTAARAKELESRGLEHGFDKDAIQVYGSANISKYGPPLKQLVNYQNQLSAYLRDSGVLSDRAYAAMLEANKLFVPFHRVMGDDAVLGQKLGGANMTAHNPIKAIEGSMKEVIDPIESIIKNTYLLTSMAEKNTVGTKLIDMLIDQRAHEAIDGRPPEMSAVPQITDETGNRAVSTFLEKNGVKSDPDLVNVLRDATTPDREGEVSIFRDGTRFTYRVDADLANAMKGLDAQVIGWIERVLKPLASTLRAGAILDPTFAARHTVRDFLYSFIKTSDGVYTPLDSVKGLVGLVTKDNDYWNWQKGGGANSTMVSLDRRFLQENLDKLAGQSGLLTRSWNVVIDPQASWLQKGGTVLGLPFKAIGKYTIHPLQMTAELAMNMNHLGGFKRAMRTAEANVKPGTALTLRDGVSPAQGVDAASVGKADIQEAAWVSRNTGIDVARSGAKTQAWNMISAFMNAKIQDTTQVLEAMAGPKSVSTTLKIIAGITLPSLVNWWANKDDSRYRDLPEWEKDVFWPILTDKWEPATADQAKVRAPDMVRLMPDGSYEVNNGHIWRVPKPFSTGVLFGSGAERLADLLYRQNPDAFKGFFHSMHESMVGDLTPNALTPILEQSANRVQYTGRTLIPQPLEKQLPEYQYANYTTELAKKLGQVIGAFPGIEEAKTEQAGQIGPGAARALSSPMLIENYVRGWTGSLGMYAMKAADLAGRKMDLLADPAHAPATLADYPIIRAFVARYPSANAQPISDFYEGYERNKIYYDTFMAQAKEGNVGALERIQKAGGMQMFSQLDDMKKVLGDHFTMIRTIDADPKMQPYEKRQLIDSLYYAMIQMGKQGNTVLKAMGR